MTGRYLEDFAVGRPSGPGVCASKRNGSRPSPPNSTRKPFHLDEEARAARYSGGWRRAAGTPPR